MYTLDLCCPVYCLPWPLLPVWTESIHGFTCGPKLAGCPSPGTQPLDLWLLQWRPTLAAPVSWCCSFSSSTGAHFIYVLFACDVNWFCTKCVQAWMVLTRHSGCPWLFTPVGPHLVDKIPLLQGCSVKEYPACNPLQRKRREKLDKAVTWVLMLQSYGS